MELVWKLPENQVEAKPWRHKLTVFHCRVLRIGLHFHEFELRSIKQFLRKGFRMECKHCGEEMKYMKGTDFNLGSTVQAVFYCRRCNEFVTISYGSPMEVRREIEEEYYSIVL